MATVDTLVIISVVCGSAWCFRKALLKLLNWINSFSSTSTSTDDIDETVTGVNYE